VKIVFSHPIKSAVAGAFGDVAVGGVVALSRGEEETF